MLHIFLPGVHALMLPLSDEDAAHSAALIIKAIFAGVFVLMNILYRVFWKNSAQSDYFEARGISVLPQPPALPVKNENVPRAKQPPTPGQCRCGYDLQAAHQRWMEIVSDDSFRCPECSREIDRDEFNQCVAIESAGSTEEEAQPV